MAATSTLMVFIIISLGIIGRRVGWPETLLFVPANLEESNAARPILRRLPAIDTFNIEPNKTKEKYRAFVCVTGQLARLELENKAQNLFRHWTENYGVEIDVALVLSDTTNFSVRRGGITGQAFFDTRQVATYLQNIPGVTVLNGDENPFVGSQNPVLNEQYFQQRSAGSSQTQEQQVQRVQNHMRQFETLERCYYHMTQDTTKKYDIVHRVREDSGYYQVVPFDNLLEMTRRYPKTIVSSSCQQHDGINDRGSFVSPDAAYDYFVNPLVHMYTKPLSTNVGSTEQYLLSTYGKSCHMLETHQFRLFRILSPKIFNAENGADDANGFDPRLIPGTNFDSEGGEVLRCLEGLDKTEPKRRKPKCHSFSLGYDVCVEVV